MDNEPSSEVVETSDFLQQETETLKDVVSKSESPAETEPSAVTINTNGESEHVNGHSDVENDVGTEETEEKEEDKLEENVTQEDPKEEQEESLAEKEDFVLDEGKGEDVKQPEPEETPEVEMEAPVIETIPEPAVVQETKETQPPKAEEKVVEKVEAPKENVEKTGDVEKTGEIEMKKEEEKMAEIAKADEDTVEAGKEEEGNKEAKEEVKEKSDAVEDEVVPAAAAKVEEKAEVKEQEEDPTPAPGSLAFAILDHDKTKNAISTTRTLVILRGLPGSGKSFLAKVFAEAYKDQCSIVCADDHDVKPSSSDGYKAFDEAIEAKCSAETSPMLVVVDDVNHDQDRLAYFGEMARQQQLMAIYLEPKTEWRRDAAQLSKKSKKGLEQGKLEAMMKVHEEMLIPLYFGWFFFFTDAEKVKEKAVNFLKALEVLDSFKKHKSDFDWKEGEKDVDLEQYFDAKVALHCTTKFTNYGKAEGAKEYTEKQVVQDLYGSVSDLSITALFVTPRTVGARVALTEDQLQLWPSDAEKEAESVIPGASNLPLGSRAHITLGCAEGIPAVQTGFDLLQIITLQKAGQQGEPVDFDQGTLTYYEGGMWYLALKEPISATAGFSSTYKAKATAPVKKEKKVKKCTIL